MHSIRHEFSFTRNIPIDEFFNLMIENRGSFTGWKFEHDPQRYTIEWSPTILLNIWKMHPKVTAVLTQVSDAKTQCTVTTENKGLIDPFKIFKRTHEKSYKKLFGHIVKLTMDYEIDYQHL